MEHGTTRSGTHPDGCQCYACGTHRTFESLLRQPKQRSGVLKEWNNNERPVEEKPQLKSGTTSRSLRDVAVYRTPMQAPQSAQDRRVNRAHADAVARTTDPVAASRRANLAQQNLVADRAPLDPRSFGRLNARTDSGSLRAAEKPLSRERPRVQQQSEQERVSSRNIRNGQPTEQFPRKPSKPPADNDAPSFRNPTTVPPRDAPSKNPPVRGKEQRPRDHNMRVTHNNAREQPASASAQPLHATWERPRVRRDGSRPLETQGDGPSAKPEPQVERTGSPVVQAIRHVESADRWTGTAPPGVEEYADDSQLFPCRSCGRSFNSKALTKHMRICKKVFVQKRKEFDVVAHRRPDDQGQPPPPPPKKSSRANERQIKPASTKWRQKSEAFRSAIRSSRMITAATEGRGPMPDFVPTPAELDDRTPCPHCGRKFNEEAANRHIPKCKNMRAKPNRLVRGAGTRR